MNFDKFPADLFEKDKDITNCLRKERERLYTQITTAKASGEKEVHFSVLRGIEKMNNEVVGILRSKITKELKDGFGSRFYYNVESDWIREEPNWKMVPSEGVSSDMPFKVVF